MPELGGTFDTSTAEKRESFPLLTGWHPAQVIESDVIATKSGGVGVKLTFEIIEGPARGRKVWGFINIQNPSPEAQRIGQSELRELCEAVGLGTVDNTDVLHFKALQLKCGADRQDAERTVPKGYKPYGAQAASDQSKPSAPASGFTPPPQQRQAAAAGGSRPWAR